APWWVLALVAPVLALVLAGSAVAASGVFTVPTYRTPSLYGLAPAAATAKLRPDQLEVARAGSQYSPSVAAGDVVAQSPLPGTMLAQGGTVHVVLSKGPAPRAVPAIASLDQTAAAAKLTAAGLGYKLSSAYSETVKAGEVVSYSPDTGLQAKGTTVTVVVSQGPRPRHVPSFPASTSYAAASAALQKLGLVPAETHAYSDSVTVGDVIASVPGPGQTVSRGATVTLSVSLGPHLVTMPDVRGKGAQQAVAELANDGLHAQVYGPDLAGTVLATNPSPGETVHYGATVDVFVL
ncbi:MAG: PASTA domain-containing protein, partial [Acidimicrobiales bacterium]